MNPKPDSLRAATMRRINRQTAAVAATIRAWQALREAEETNGDTETAMSALRTALDNLEYEIEKA